MPAKKHDVRLFSADSPRRPGHEPQPGDQDWVLDLPLSDGRKLYLSVGKIGHDALVQMFTEEASDDRDDREDLAILLRRFCHASRDIEQLDTLRERAFDYLKRKNLQGDILR